MEAPSRSRPRICDRWLEFRSSWPSRRPRAPCAASDQPSRSSRSRRGGRRAAASFARRRAGRGVATCTATAAWLARPTNFALIREESAPYSQHFLQNAAQLADNLEWYTSNVDADVGRQLKAEIVEFAAQYRRDGYTPYGPMPGLPDLQTAYDALSAHFARYQSTPSGFATPLPEALVGTIERNVANARRMPPNILWPLGTETEPVGGEGGGRGGERGIGEDHAVVRHHRIAAPSGIRQVTPIHVLCAEPRSLLQNSRHKICIANARKNGRWADSVFGAGHASRHKIYASLSRARSLSRRLRSSSSACTACPPSCRSCRRRRRSTARR